jgi:EAL domain-containing protein (putative c-di-GMP-specific phosphodiesterase class I)
MKSLSSIFDKKFTQHYQPIIDMHSLELIRYEALLRPLGFASDTESLVRQMERAGEIRELDLWSIKSALSSIDGKKNLPSVAINLSAKSLCDPLFHEEVEWLLMEKGSVANIGFEITESEPITDFKMARRFVSMAQGLKCSVGLDDFGTGHARFRVAEHLELDYIKLSARLTTMITSSSQARALIEKTVKMSRLAGMEVVGEHIDNPIQYAWLRNSGVDLGQGWLFGKAAIDLYESRNFRAELDVAIKEVTAPDHKEKSNRVVNFPGLALAR